MINPALFLQTEKLKESYHAGHPFPFVVIENFLTSHLANLILQECKKFKNYDYDGKYVPDNHWAQHNKEYIPSPIEEHRASSREEMQKYMPLTWHTINYLNSTKVINWIGKITNIGNLEGDPTFLGGGVHKISNEGYLDVHTDYEINWIIRKRRRLNLLLYLNHDWQDSYNGNLELWDENLQNCVWQVKPTFNKAIIFRTTGAAFHGHPIPLSVPDTIARYSLALYYYTDDVKDNEELKIVDFRRPDNARDIKHSTIL